MERLTFDGNFCDISQCREMPCPHGGSCTQRKVWEKLKAYEDTGLTPEEVNDVMAKAKLASAFGVAAERLRELAEADKAGRLVVLPEGGDKSMTIQEICRNVEDLLRDDKGRTNFSPAARYAVRMLLDYAERAAALEASGQDKDARITEQEKLIADLNQQVSFLRMALYDAGA